MKQLRKKIFYKNAASLFAIICSIVLVAGLFSSCITIRINTVKGSRDIAVKEFETGQFSILNFSGIGKIIIEQGDEESLKVEAESNVLNAISVTSSANRLSIGLKRGFRVIPTKEVLLYLKVKDLSKIDLSGAGIIECDNLQAGSFSIDSSGLGSIKINIFADSLQTNISGAGKVEMSGKVNNQQISISGVGSYFAKDLESKNCAVNISGAGKAVVNVIETLDVKMSGFGSVEYSGSPSITQNISGVGGTVKSLD